MQPFISLYSAQVEDQFRCVVTGASKSRLIHGQTERAYITAMTYYDANGKNKIHSFIQFVYLRRCAGSSTDNKVAHKVGGVTLFFKFFNPPSPCHTLSQITDPSPLTRSNSGTKKLTV